MLRPSICRRLSDMAVSCLVHLEVLELDHLVRFAAFCLFISFPNSQDQSAALVLSSSRILTEERMMDASCICNSSMYCINVGNAVCQQ